MKSAKLWSRLMLALVAAGLMAAPAMAKLVKGSQYVVLWGVDSLCSPDNETLGAEVSTKVYRDSHTGIISLTAKGKVTNECGCKITLKDLGVTLIDPCDGAEYTATKDSESINAPKKCKCKCSSCDYTASATLVACYVPSCDCAPDPVPALR